MSRKSEFPNSEQLCLCALLMIHTNHCNNTRSYKTNRKLLYKYTNLDYVI